MPMHQNQNRNRSYFDAAYELIDAKFVPDRDSIDVQIDKVDQ